MTGDPLNELAAAIGAGIAARSLNRDEVLAMCRTLERSGERRLASFGSMILAAVFTALHQPQARADQAATARQKATAAFNGPTKGRE